MDCNATADTLPKPVDVDLGQKTAAVVEEALALDRSRTHGQGRSDPELAQRPHRVARQVQAGTGRLPLGHPLHDLDDDLALIQGTGQAKTSDTCTDDQHTQGGHRASSSRLH
jgi:hypothetical protein